MRAVLQYTGARQVDIVAHSLGVTVAREWMLQDDAYRQVRALVAIDGPNHGIINCSPSPLNFWQQPSSGGFTPNSAVCDEYGSDQTQLLATLNAAGETAGPTRYLVIRNVFRASPESGDFVYLPSQDGVLPGVPAQDRYGNAHDFSASALLAGAPSIDLVGQGQYDPILQSAHLGILNSPNAWGAALQFAASNCDTLMLTVQVADSRYRKFLNYDRDAIDPRLPRSLKEIGGHGAAADFKPSIRRSR